MRRRVMIVDDSLIVRRQVQNALAAAGFEVTHAVDGVDALAKVDETPDLVLIFCDVNMPRMGGLELIEALASRGSSIPVVMLTTEAERSLIARADASGAKGWIVKPFDAEMLVETADLLTAGSAEP